MIEVDPAFAGMTYPCAEIPRVGSTISRGASGFCAMYSLMLTSEDTMASARPAATSRMGAASPSATIGVTVALGKLSRATCSSAVPARTTMFFPSVFRASQSASLLLSRKPRACPQPGPLIQAPLQSADEAAGGTGPDHGLRTPFRQGNVGGCNARRVTPVVQDVDGVAGRTRASG